MYPEIEIPFNYRHQCWFCAEPRYSEIPFPKFKQEVSFISHPPMMLPACYECSSIVKRSAYTTVMQYRQAVKKALAVKHKKILDIGLNWTKEELAEVELEGRMFEGFKRSAWPMYELTQARIDFAGWDIVIDGEPIHIEQDSEAFIFDGETYASLESAIQFAVKRFFLDELLFVRVLAYVGKHKFNQVIRLCRLYPMPSDDEREDVYQHIIQSFND